MVEFVTVVRDALGLIWLGKEDLPVVVMNLVLEISFYCLQAACGVLVLYVEMEMEFSMHCGISSMRLLGGYD